MISWHAQKRSEVEKNNTLFAVLYGLIIRRLRIIPRVDRRPCDVQRRGGVIRLIFLCLNETLPEYLALIQSLHHSDLCLMSCVCFSGCFCSSVLVRVVGEDDFFADLGISYKDFDMPDEVDDFYEAKEKPEIANDP